MPRSDDLTPNSHELVRNRREAKVEDRWNPTAPSAFMTGVHAVLRGFLDHLRAERAAGLNTAGFISGYQCSPLGKLNEEIKVASVERWREGVERALATIERNASSNFAPAD